MAGGAQALSQAERDAQTTQPEETATHDARGDAEMRSEQQEPARNGSGIFLQDQGLALGEGLITQAERRSKAGKAPAVSGEMRTPEAAEQRHSTPATARYRGQTQAGLINTGQAESSIAAAGRNATAEQEQRRTPWGLWSAAGKEKKDLHVTQGSISTILDDSRRHRLDTYMKGMEHT